MIFSGGMPYDKASRTPSLTVMQAKSTTVLEMEHNVVDFLTLCSTPYNNGMFCKFNSVELVSFYLLKNAKISSSKWQFIIMKIRHVNCWSQDVACSGKIFNKKENESY